MKSAKLAHTNNSLEGQMIIRDVKCDLAAPLLLLASSSTPHSSPRRHLPTRKSLWHIESVESSGASSIFHEIFLWMRTAPALRPPQRAAVAETHRRLSYIFVGLRKLSTYYSVLTY